MLDTFLVEKQTKMLNIIYEDFCPKKITPICPKRNTETNNYMEPTFFHSDKIKAQVNAPYFFQNQEAEKNVKNENYRRSIWNTKN